MTDEARFLSVESVLAIHARVTREFGGASAVRDHGLLESANSMPAATFGGEFLHYDLPSMAAAYLFHICQNHPFTDGNKRVALTAAETFLELNGMRFTADDSEAEVLTRAVAEGRMGKDAVTLFFRSHVELVKPS